MREHVHSRVFVTRGLLGNALQMLHDAFGEKRVRVYPDDRIIGRGELLEGVRGAAGILCMLTERIDAEVFDAAGPQLKAVANFAVGYNNIDLGEATRRGIAVCNTPDVLTETTADLAFALMLGVARRFRDAESYLREGRWTSWSPSLLLGQDVHGKTLGIFGLGRIGQAVARRARGFDMRVLYHNRKPVAGDVEREFAARYVDKATLLAESDIITIHTPLNDETRHAIGSAEFKAMKKSAILVNTARGPIVNEGELAAALKTGEIWGAGIDVFEKEPKIDPELLACPNALLLPHVGSATGETRAKMAELAAANLIACLTGKTPPSCVNPEAFAQVGGRS
jgi:glyoxylate reductase